MDGLQAELIKYAEKHQWRLQAWAIFPNHYHLIALPPKDGAILLPPFLKEFHSRSARWVNQLDNVRGRKIWHNYRESELTLQTSYFARLNYVHQNAVKHGLVPVANQYRWCSASWFEQNADKAFVNTIYQFKTDKLAIEDDF
ncbi:hypothetical protein AAFN60_00690 [Roseibacillus persicicus]|uniref:transposase n=1 Tax=Roseibacillus persicicus TaxID=454148 RepID=UPI00398BAE62